MTMQRYSKYIYARKFSCKKSTFVSSFTDSAEVLQRFAVFCLSLLAKARYYSIYCKTAARECFRGRQHIDYLAEKQLTEGCFGNICLSVWNHHCLLYAVHCPHDEGDGVHADVADAPHSLRAWAAAHGVRGDTCQSSR